MISTSGRTGLFTLRAVFILVSCTALAASTRGADVLTQHNDIARTGANLNEAALTPDALRQGELEKLCFRAVDGNIYAQPLYVTGVDIQGRAGAQDVVIVATEHNSVFAFDARDIDQNSATAQFWKATGFGKPVPSEVLSKDLSGAPEKCVDLTTEIGITSTPVVSPDKKLLYVVAKSLDQTAGNHYSYKLHVLKLSDGTAAVTPIEIEGQITGDGKGSVGGKIHFDPKIQLNRPGLLLNNNVLYIAFGGHCDRLDYHGWLFAYDVANTAQIQKLDLFCTSPKEKAGETDGKGGIWQSGQGPAADAAGNIYFATGDGSYNATTDFGDSIVKLKIVNGKFQVQDWFTPQNHADLQRDDADLGSGGPVLLPESHLLMAGGKEGRLYLIDRENMGKGLVHSLRSFQVTNGPLPLPNSAVYWNLHGGPATWLRRNALGQPSHMYVYLCGEEDHVKQYKLVVDNTPGSVGWKLDAPAGQVVPPFKKSAESAPYPNFPVGEFNNPNRGPIWMPGGAVSLSASGDGATSTGILWVSMPLAENSNHRVVKGILRAYDAEDITTELWNSEKKPADGVGLHAKFCPPTVGGGKVFLAANQEEEPLGNNDFQVHKVKQNGLKPALAIYGIRQP